ncbi:multidrug efflux SMR transporter [Thalassotalea sp. HSM 43]|uniref:DMT family transporter n=1 Tax=Thalassotalea sp. HSM 43 TaxID=2552945 RepID=UPI0010800168|nr:multidrug efflux SMR transporter [Thalassotalea sp. HSM 43]QBY05400.1 multidrug efflux SMR transporter [Thalassotalea sp. HSM 43]
MEADLLAYTYLIIASLFEVLWVLFLGKSIGFTAWRPSALAVFCMMLSLFFLAKATKDLPLATAYGTWVGLGILGTALLQHSYSNNQLTTQSWFCLIMLVLSIIGLHISMQR